MQGKGPVGFYIALINCLLCTKHGALHCMEADIQCTPYLNRFIDIIFKGSRCIGGFANADCYDRLGSCIIRIMMYLVIKYSIDLWKA